MKRHEAALLVGSSLVCIILIVGICFWRGGPRAPQTSVSVTDQPLPVRDEKPRETQSDRTSTTESSSPVFRDKNSVINALQLKLSTLKKYTQPYYSLKYLIGQFNRAKNNSPHLMPDFEGIIFGATVSVHKKSAQTMGGAWVATLEELGCHLSEQQALQIVAIVVDMVDRNRIEAEELMPDDELNAVQTEMYFSFLEGVRGILHPEDFSRFRHFLRELSLRTERRP